VTLVANLRTVWRYRVLIQNLVSRELKARYRGTILGFLWSFLNPLLLMIVYTVVFGLILNPRDEAIGATPWLYSLYMFCGILPWTWFSSSSSSANVLMISSSLIKDPSSAESARRHRDATSSILLRAAHPPHFHPIMGNLPPYILLPRHRHQVRFHSLQPPHLGPEITSAISDILSNVMIFWFFSTPIIYSSDGGPAVQDRQAAPQPQPMTHIIEAVPASSTARSSPGSG
jgi:ABC-type polysaccharide/polyol phosphate export permease